MAERRHVRRPPLLPVAIIVVFVAVAGLAGVASPADPYAQHLRARLAPPIWSEGGAWTHPLGTDRLGRDLLSRILYGARVSLAAGVVTVALAGAIGAGGGPLPGYPPRPPRAPPMRLPDATLAFPNIPLAPVPALPLGPRLPTPAGPMPV